MHRILGMPVQLARFPEWRPAVARAMWWFKTRVARVLLSLRNVPAERWFWLGMAALMALYIIIFLIQPSGAGRGGR